ncbi:hypothetical protein [Arachidicoccus soli]|uniref:CUB domain-containing protein n=1 Tax=Arachidicoccus soli TaxID=2341117 RepID=A0A386HSS1_9BACT|nr:hypothetical protein [Arachidicoccus soli]AYD48709.1 hypothetical protein D6B99_14505 [Arachidicoccus soli]
MIKWKLIVFFLFSNTLFLVNNASGQIIFGAKPGGGNSLSLSASFNPSPYNALHFDTYTDCINAAGKTAASALTVAFSPQGNYAATSGYTLKVSSSDFVNGSSSIPAQYVSLNFNSFGGNNPYPSITSSGSVSLANTSKTLVTFTTPLTVPSYYYTQLFDVHVAGGNQLLVPTTGNYTGTITLSFCDASGAVVSSTTVQVIIEIGFSNSCSGVSLAINQPTTPNFTTYAQISSGQTATDAVHVQYTPNGANCVGWYLKVRANGNFTNGTNTITPDHISLAFNNVSTGSPSAAAIGVTNTPVALSTSDVSLINNSQAAFNGYTEHQFDMIVQGGNYLLVAGSGTFTCTLTFSIYNASGTLVATQTLNASFIISYSNSSSATMSLAHTGVSLPFTTQANYTSGVSVTQTQELSVTAYNAYQIIAKTQDANLTSGTHTIPVSVIQLTNTANPTKTGIVSTPISLTNNDQQIITNPMTNSTFQSVKYDLTYSISGNNSTIFQSSSGTYTTNIIYILLPN